LFVGTLGYGPNVDAVRWFVAEVMPRIWASKPNIRFCVAGYGSAELLHDVFTDSRVEAHESPEDLSPLYAAAAVVVTPVRMGGGTRIKILDALARGRAVVSTTFAAQGLGLLAGTHLEYADTPRAMASVTLQLLSDAERRRRLGTAGRDYVAASFDWRAIECKLPELISRLARCHVGPASPVGE
jgi:glycosyltransferase involved in cell wall biosynthesis